MLFFVIHNTPYLHRLSSSSDSEACCCELARRFPARRCPAAHWKYETWLPLRNDSRDDWFLEFLGNFSENRASHITMSDRPSVRSIIIVKLLGALVKNVVTRLVAGTSLTHTSSHSHNILPSLISSLGLWRSYWHHNSASLELLSLKLLGYCYKKGQIFDTAQRLRGTQRGTVLTEYSNYVCMAGITNLSLEVSSCWKKCTNLEERPYTPYLHTQHLKQRMW